MMALFPFDMTGHEIFFASCEARAHLNHLVTTGHLQNLAEKMMSISCKMLTATPIDLASRSVQKDTGLVKQKGGEHEW